MKLNNRYYILRHGEALSNVKKTVSCWPEKFKNPLTKKGRMQVKEAARRLKKRSIDLIFTSPLLRTEQTAEIIAGELKTKEKSDKRLREICFGVFSAGPEEKFERHFKNEKEKISSGVPKGESYKEVLKRTFDFFEEINKKYKSKNILIVSHQAPLFLLEGKLKGYSILQNINRTPEAKRIKTGELRKLN